MARVFPNPDFLEFVGIGASAGVGACTDVYMVVIAERLSNESYRRTGEPYYTHEDTIAAVGDHERDPNESPEDSGGEERGRIHIPSRAGEPPAQLTGRLRLSAGSRELSSATEVVAQIGPNAVNPETGEFYGQTLELDLNRPAWGFNDSPPSALTQMWPSQEAWPTSLMFETFKAGFQGSAA